MRAIGIGLAAAITLVLACSPPPVLAQDGPLGEQIVDVMNRLWGSHPGLRANHTKGIVVEGRFTPSSAGARLTTAAIFQGGEPTPVTARFSNATGLPDIADGAPNANPHGLAVRFHLPDGGEMDIVANSLAFFPVRTGEEFHELLSAAAASGPDAPRPTPIQAFMEAHPAAPKALGSVATPTSFARETYNGINAFVFVDAAGQRRPFRFRLTPVAGPAHLSKEEAAKEPPGFLIEGLKDELARAPVKFRLLAQLAAPEDPTGDATQAWPEDRELVDLGELTLTQPVADNAAAEKELLFLPGNLAAGIEPSDDPLIGLRDEAYAVSFGRRSQ